MEEGTIQLTGSGATETETERSAEDQARVVNRQAGGDQLNAVRSAS